MFKRRTLLYHDGVGPIREAISRVYEEKPHKEYFDHYVSVYRARFKEQTVRWYCVVENSFDYESKKTTTTIIEEQCGDPPKLVEINIEAKRPRKTSKKKVLDDFANISLAEAAANFELSWNTTVPGPESL